MSRRPAPTTALSADLGAYDNKLVASTLSLPSASASAHDPPTSPIASVFPALHHVATTTSSIHAGLSGSGILHSAVHHAPSTSAAAVSSLTSPVGRSLSTLTSSLPSTSASASAPSRPAIGTSVEANSHPSHPSSPWSVLSLHILPIFNGVPLLSPIEDLNLLAEAHIQSCRTRSPRRYHRLVSSDLQELISSGMLTIRAKLEPPVATRMEDPARLVARVAEVWSFFFALLPGVFLPISLLDNVAFAKTGSSIAATSTTNVRRLLLSGFLLHILLPLLPALLGALDPALYSAAWRTPILLVAPPHNNPVDPTSPASTPHPRAIPTPDHLARIKHLALILSTQSRSSDFFILFEQGGAPPPQGMEEDDNWAAAAEQRELARMAARDAQDRADMERLLDAVVRLRYGTPLPPLSPVPDRPRRGVRSNSGLNTPVSGDDSDSASTSDLPHPRRRHSTHHRHSPLRENASADDMRSSTRVGGPGTYDVDGSETDDEDSVPTRRPSGVTAVNDDTEDATWGLRRAGGAAGDGGRGNEEEDDAYLTLKAR
ncbi:hypothetical protein QFC19_004451 [Naganishia cerealis]|uniref:Uncharacterized protein n=1 Tax=Naganishia cerealis TaxID=610337 RepID=A0ACC2VW37_9TREE|nr:hypothetical protein QFC19_004451 [Naganishia cerealis]